MVGVAECGGALPPAAAPGVECVVVRAGPDCSVARLAAGSQQEAEQQLAPATSLLLLQVNTVGMVVRPDTAQPRPAPPHPAPPSHAPPHPSLLGPYSVNVVNISSRIRAMCKCVFSILFVDRELLVENVISALPLWL